MKRFAYVGLTVVSLSGLLSAQPPRAQTTTAPDISFDSVPDFLQLPEGMNFGEVPGVAVNSKGHVFVFTRSNSAYGPAYGPTAAQLLEFGPNGEFVREVGKQLYGWSFAHSVRIDKDDNIWAIDKGSDMVIKFNPAGRVQWVFGRRQESAEEAKPWEHVDPPLPARDGLFRQPTDVAWDSHGNIYITDGYIDSRVAKYDRNGDWVKQWGTKGTGPGQFNTPHSIAIDRMDNVYVGDRGNRRVQVFDTDGKFLRQFSVDVPPDFSTRAVNGPTPQPGSMQGVGAPNSLCIPPNQNEVMFLGESTWPGRVFKLTLDGKVVGVIGKSGRNLRQFSGAHALACPTANEIYVAESSNWRVQKIVLRATPQAAAPARAPAQPKMVEDVFKNVQALKGIGVDDFMLTMGIMSAAVGSDCVGCHPSAGTDHVDWALDTPRKRTARRMVQMVTAINRDNFNGRQVVTCWTCHRGRDKPVTTMTMDVVYGPATDESDDVLAQAQGGSTVDQVLDKYLKAIGGAENVARMTSFVASGKSVGYRGFGGEGRVEVSAQAPDKRATHISFPEYPDRGVSVRTYDGRTGWIATPLAVVPKYELAGSERDGARIDAMLAFPAQIKQALTSLRIGPSTTIADRDVTVLQGNGPNGTLATLYFDEESGLLVRMVRHGRSPIGRVPTQVDYADYRDVGGIKIPFKWTFAWLDGRDTFEFSDVKLNVPIEAGTFGEPNIAPKGPVR